MKRSEINAAVRAAEAAFARHGWALPSVPCWDVTDFGLGCFARTGLVCVNLAEQPEYCEKIMYVRRLQVTPWHKHRLKKEDIICRWGRLAIAFRVPEPPLRVEFSGEWDLLSDETPRILCAGERATVTPGLVHRFWAVSDYAVVGEVSTANDDVRDNLFEDDRIGRFAEIEEDEPPLVRLAGETGAN